ncbi:POT family proton-dependent oligopeptide transporter [Sphingomonas sp. UYAg733]
MDLIWIGSLAISVVTAIPVALQLRHHPKGLATLFFLEMWERFSYYGMRALLIFYLTQHFLFDDVTAQGQYGAFTSLAYLLPLVGGMVADRLFGLRKTVMLGASLLLAGHALMAIESPASTQIITHRGVEYSIERSTDGPSAGASIIVKSARYPLRATPSGGLEIDRLPPNSTLPRTMAKGEYALSTHSANDFAAPLLFLALACIAVGVGLLKPNVAAMVGSLYARDDPRRDQGFTLYYYGINLGAFWAAIVCGWLGQTVGWWAGFGAAGLGMFIGLIAFHLGRSSFGADRQGSAEPPKAAPRTNVAVCGLTIVIVALVWFVLQHNAMVGAVLTAGSLAMIVYIAWFVVRRCSAEERQSILLAVTLVSTAVVFFTLNEQAGSSLNQFAERNTQLGLGVAGAMTAAQTQSINGAFLLIGAPAFAALWTWLGRRRSEPDPLVKFGIAMILAGAGFYVLSCSAPFADAESRVPLLFLTATYLLLAVGELCLTPVGLSQMTRLAPAALGGTMLAVWYLSLSWAQWLGAKLATLTAADTIAGQVTDPHLALTNYVRVFSRVGLVSVAIGCTLCLAMLAYRRYGRGSHGTAA